MNMQIDDLTNITDDEFNNLKKFIHVNTGISLADHKKVMVCSRLAKRLRFHGFSNYSDYYTLLSENDDGQELLEMINAITTNKTEFFRENHHFEYLADTIIPKLINQNKMNTSKRLRIWSAGSSTGEEAYSIAITISETLAGSFGWDIKILASDIDTNVLEFGNKGIYTNEHVQKINKEMLHRYFKIGEGKNKGKVIVKEILKDMIRFRRLNLLEEPWPMSQTFDIIFCRNVIIYFDKDTQRKLIKRMYNLLSDSGYLMLGHSESLHSIHDGFEHVGRNIYIPKRP